MDGDTLRQQYIMFLGLLLASGTLISLTFSGAWVDSTDLDVVNSLTVFKEYNIAGYWSISAPNLDFFFTGAKALTMFDFGFFTGGLQLLQWFFFLVFGLGFIWGVYTIIITVFSSVFRR